MLLRHVRVQSLKSLAVSLMHEEDPQALIGHFVRKSKVGQLDSLLIECNHPIKVDFQGLLRPLQLKTLPLSITDEMVLGQAVRSLDFKRLQILSVFSKEYD